MEIFGKGKEMTNTRRISYMITVVASTLLLSLFAVQLTYAAKAKSDKPAGKAKQDKLTKEKLTQFIQRVQKNNPGRAQELRDLRKNNPAKFRKAVRKALKARANQPGFEAEKTTNPKGHRQKQHRFAQMGQNRGGRGKGGRFAQMGQNRGGRGRGGRFAQMGQHLGGRGRGGRFAQMGQNRGGRGRGGRFAQMGHRRGGRGRGGQFAQMGHRRGGRGRGGQFGRRKYLGPAESDIWGDD